MRSTADDMIRYPLLSAGSSWTDEYGNPQKYEVCKTLAGRIVAVSQSFRRHRLSASAHYHEPQRRPRPSRPRAQVLRQTARNLAAILALRPGRRRPYRQRHATRIRRRTYLRVAVFERIFGVEASSKTDRFVKLRNKILLFRQVKRRPSEK